MKRISAIFFIILAGCATAPNPLVKEVEAWKRGEIIAAERCFDGKIGDAAIAAVTRKNVRAYDSCMSQVKSEIVEPSVAFPDLYAHNNLDSILTRDKYAAGKISKEQYIAENKARFHAYLFSVEQRLVQNAQMNAALSAQRQQAGMALLNYSAQIQALKVQRQNAAAPIQTNCIRNPMGFNCTSY